MGTFAQLFQKTGFSLGRNSVWSEKIGWREFHQVVVVAYVLEGTDAADEEFGKLIDNTKKDKDLETIRFFAALADAPAYVVKVVSETYGEDFWELWKQIRNVAKRRFYRDMQEEPKEVEPVSTMDFFEETMENLNDKRFLALWKIYDKMLHDSDMEEAGSVIFVPDGPEYENIGLHYVGAPPRRRLKGSWGIMKQEEKNNKARMTFRRYMALLENKKLRKEVFGF